ncbi:Gfo/Idh/MocA family oxidoreductase [Treponema sp. OMZ 840]
MNYAPISTGIVRKAVEKGRFFFSVIGLDHGHISAMVNGIEEAGGTILNVYDKDPQKVDAFIKAHPSCRRAADTDKVLCDCSSMVLSAIRPDKRFYLGEAVMNAGKDFFVDKPGFLKLSEVQKVRELSENTKRRYIVYFGERIHVEGAVLAQQMIDEGRLGDIVSIQILAPHRLNAATRPDWFWDAEKNGGILTDIGSHQLEQILSYAHANSGTILSASVGNFNNPAHPDFQDYGQVSFVTDNGVQGFCRVDWFTPDGLKAWGDGRVFIVGTKGILEIRKYVDVAVSDIGDHIYFVDNEGEHHICAAGRTGYPFFGELILDCINRTENAVSQEHVLNAMELALQAQDMAVFYKRSINENEKR